MGTDWPKRNDHFLKTLKEFRQERTKKRLKQAILLRFPADVCKETAVLPPNVMQELGNKIDIAKPTVVLISVAQRSSSLGGMEHFWDVRSWIYLSGESGIYCPTEATHVSGWV